MGYLLKEALKTLCGVNQWCYAVFWKLGCQNPKLLIWEECYYEPMSYSNITKTPGTMNSGLSFDKWDAQLGASQASTSQLPAPEVHLLVNKMMMENQLNMVGEGLVGRAAFTGNHQWSVSEKYAGEAHPPEVLKELSQQFSAGMETVTVIPVLPHGVVQLGSSLAIRENVAFVNDVKNFILQLGCVPGILLSNNCTIKQPAPRIGLPVYPGNTVSVDTMNSASFPGRVHNQTDSVQTASGQVHDKLKSSGSGFECSHVLQDAIIGSLTKPNILSVGQLVNGVTKAEVIHSDPDVWANRPLYIPRSMFQQQSSISSLAMNNSSFRFLEQIVLSDAGFQNNIDNNLCTCAGSMMSSLGTNTCVSSSCHVNAAAITPSLEVNEICTDVNSHLRIVPGLDYLQNANRSFNKNIPGMNPAGNGFQHANSLKTNGTISHMMDNLTTSHLLSSDHYSEDNTVEAPMKGGAGNDLFRAFSNPLPQHSDYLKSNHTPAFSYDDEKQRSGTQIMSLDGSKFEDESVQHESGNGLFDIFGIEFRKKMMNCSSKNFPKKGYEAYMQSCNENDSTSWTSNGAASDMCAVNQGNSESGTFCATGRDAHDHLLDAVISRDHPSSKLCLDDDVSCNTTLTNMSSSSVPDTSSLAYSQARVSGQMQGGIFGLWKSLSKAGSVGSCSLLSGSSKDNAGTNSPSSSIYGSPISSWTEQNYDVKQSSGVSTRYSKKTDQVSKTNRKRLKPGEVPRPRPKDRQMIQDCLKELREIVPNGAKCSIDALLERTIKHMLFLQSVTKHADKLKQTGDSNMFCEEGGVLEDNFGGGATWAHEVGSQSMVCPIIVQDLNQPRQMLVEMLCEQRGLFLEIADIIRGLGLTILKGVMETRSAKIWARFAVEANRDVTRMEIFISLVHVMEQTAKSRPPPSNLNSDDLMVHQFHQATSLSRN